MKKVGNKVTHSVALFIIEVFFGLSLIVWIVGWPLATRLESNNELNGTVDDNTVSIFYFVFVIMLSAIIMFLLLGSLLPHWKGYITRWAMLSVIVFSFINLCMLANTMYLTVGYVGFKDCDEHVDADFCKGSKLIFGSSVGLIITTSVSIGYAIWLLTELVLVSIMKVETKTKQSYEKLVNSSSDSIYSISTLRSSVASEEGTQGSNISQGSSITTGTQSFI
eukprot:TRINITY_DN1861_c0_g1_i2.p1 TRINITY_DN1861_c0_g1~~TRINITY_DN1861_c0_g1_i2.p1  ORF type:complete len:238 (-),score=29.75 TRINITY_DN1861_c0_g1_i2:90-755(-)